MTQGKFMRQSAHDDESGDFRFNRLEKADLLHGVLSRVTKGWVEALPGMPARCEGPRLVDSERGSFTPRVPGRFLTVVYIDFTEECIVQKSGQLQSAECTQYGD